MPLNLVHIGFGFMNSISIIRAGFSSKQQISCSEGKVPSESVLNGKIVIRKVVMSPELYCAVAHLSGSTAAVSYHKLGGKVPMSKNAFGIFHVWGLAKGNFRGSCLVGGKI